MYVRPELRARLRPNNAGWYAGDDPYASYYGPPMNLTADARSLDTSPAWFSWVGTEAALQTFLDIGVEKIHEHNVALANRFRRRTRARAEQHARSSRPAATPRGSSRPGSGPRSAPAGCALPSTSTTPRTTWTPRSRRSERERPPAGGPSQRRFERLRLRHRERLHDLRLAGRDVRRHRRDRAERAVPVGRDVPGERRRSARLRRRGEDGELRAVGRLRGTMFCPLVPSRFSAPQFVPEAGSPAPIVP